jgi:acyl dehydratase
MKYFEDIRVGEKKKFGRHTFGADEIKTFARSYDPQPFHVDDEAAAGSHFGALCASGWHTACVWMKLATEQRRRDEEKQREAGEIAPRRGPSPGFRDLKWLKPVYVGDTITFAGEIIETRALRSRPEWGLVFSLNTGTNQNGELVLSFIGSLFVERRPQVDKTTVRK